MPEREARSSASRQPQPRTLSRTRSGRSRRCATGLAAPVITSFGGPKCPLGVTSTTAVLPTSARPTETPPRFDRCEDAAVARDRSSRAVRRSAPIVETATRRRWREPGKSARPAEAVGPGDPPLRLRGSGTRRTATPPGSRKRRDACDPANSSSCRATRCTTPSWCRGVPAMPGRSTRACVRRSRIRARGSQAHRARALRAPAQAISCTR